jgi:hypothetical protein
MLAYKTEILSYAPMSPKKYGLAVSTSIIHMCAVFTCGTDTSRDWFDMTFDEFESMLGVVVEMFCQNVDINAKVED